MGRSDAAASSTPADAAAVVTADASTRSEAATSSSDSGVRAPDAGDAESVVVDKCKAATSCTTVGEPPSGEVNGDASDPAPNSITIEGNGAQWVAVEVVESIRGLASIIPQPMSYTATLTSPSNSNFDLIAYMPNDSGNYDCATPSKTSVAPEGEIDTISDHWDDLGNHTDTKRILFEVRHVAGTCSLAEKWTLVVTGHQ